MMDRTWRLTVPRGVSRLVCLWGLIACASAPQPAPATAPSASAAAVPTGATAPPANTEELPTAPDVVADTLLADIRTVAPRVRVELRYATGNNFTGAPLPGYEGNHAYLRREAAAALARVAVRAEREGFVLHVFDAYRPVRNTRCVAA